VKVLVDTCVWSLALRKNHAQNNTTVQKLYELIKYDKIQIIGAIRQEILSA